jgi:signal transduction histidine kinase
VAQRVASHGERERVFAPVTDELSELPGLEMVRTIRYWPIGSATTVAAQGGRDDPRARGRNFPLPERGVLERFVRTAQPVPSTMRRAAAPPAQVCAKQASSARQQGRSSLMDTSGHVGRCSPDESQARIVRAADDARRRVGRDLHDGA